MATDEPQVSEHKVLDELFEMQKGTFNGVLAFSWLVSLLALIVNLFLWPEGVKPWLIWISITPLNLGTRWLARRHFRRATWVWVCVAVLLLVWFIRHRRGAVATG